MNRNQNFFWMSKLIAASLLLPMPSSVLAAASSQHQTKSPEHLFSKNPGENDTDFVRRNIPPAKPPLLSKTQYSKPDTTRFSAPWLMHGPIAARWNSTSVIIAFYGVTCIQTLHGGALDTSYDIEGSVFVPAGQPNQFRRISIGAIPNVDSVVAVFFANADHDPAKELGILASSEADEQSHNRGRTYRAIFYDDISSKQPDTLEYLRAVSEDIVKESSDEFNWDGERLGEYYYSTVAEVRKRLKKAGY